MEGRLPAGWEAQKHRSRPRWRLETPPERLDPKRTVSAAVLATVPLELEAGKSYTVLVAGAREALTTTVAVDSGPGVPLPPLPPGEPPDSGNPPPPTVDYARFRIVHAAPHAPPLDPYLQPTGAPLDTVPVFLPFEYGSLALILDAIRPAGHYTVAFAEAGTRNVVLESPDIAAAAGDLLVVVLGENGDRSLRVDVIRE